MFLAQKNRSQYFVYFIFTNSNLTIYYLGE